MSEFFFMCLLMRYSIFSRYCDLGPHHSAHCKTKNLLANVSKESIIIYIGDGRSDVCPSQYADIVFAKDDLLAHFKDKNLTCFSYRNLRDVHDYFKRSFS